MAPLPPRTKSFTIGGHKDVQWLKNSVRGGRGTVKNIFCQFVGIFFGLEKYRPCLKRGEEKKLCERDKTDTSNCQFAQWKVLYESTKMTRNVAQIVFSSMKDSQKKMLKLINCGLNVCIILAQQFDPGLPNTLN